MNLLEDLVDVGRVCFLTLALSLLLVAVCWCSRLLCGLACLSSSGFCQPNTRQLAQIQTGLRFNSLAALPPVDAGALPPVEAGALDAGLGGMIGT